MTITEARMQEVAAQAVKARYLREIGELDYRRSVAFLAVVGISQTTIAKLVGVKQPTIHRLLERAKSVPMPREGFSGADPFEI